MPKYKINIYVTCLLSFAIFDEKFSYFSFLKNQDFDNVSKGIEFLKNELISELEYDGLVDTN